MRGGEGVCSGLVLVAPVLVLATAAEETGDLTGDTGFLAGSSRNVMGVFALV